ncbi:MAG: response regulator [Bacteroidetes bacterium]|nr:response regulator [Bacteroidota bacterium]
MTEEKEFSILIIDDESEMREVIDSILNPLYNTFLAENGKAGFEIAKREIPDIILTDVAMPDVNGIEFCLKLKSTFETAHIPVVMITAKAMDEDQLRGYESGATDYITKPFNIAILRHKVKNILETVKKLRDRFTLENKNVEDYTTNSHDAKLMQSIIAYIDKNYQKTELSIEILSAELGMSKSTLYRKLKSITGKSAVDIIQEFRLQKAHTLLSNSSMNISEIAYSVGYTDPGYFSTRFKERFNIAPSAISKSTSPLKENENE